MLLSSLHYGHKLLRRRNHLQERYGNCSPRCFTGAAEMGWDNRAQMTVAGESVGRYSGVVPDFFPNRNCDWTSGPETDSGRDSVQTCVQRSHSSEKFCI
ncbi:hypothetical protein AVEN_45392-1 [Araneus ventricosus]|uniref:Uncharacterized protein n=1 Tax=Araneus ventricosus TaxID=182803 RepID=A0A4Y2A2L5_ARAVE|nr:hypothetical protein AVEN_45392-1 [Araneus ventricosus]